MNWPKKSYGKNINTVCIKNGIDTQVFSRDTSIEKSEVLRKFGVSKDYEHVVSFVGKLTDFKGVDVLLDSASMYEDDDTLTLISGDGKLRGSLEEQAKSLNLENVRFLGNQPQTVLKDIYNIADVSCVPSRREPFGLVAAEAMACGTPVIATNEGGLPDFINEKVGTLVPVDDPKQLSFAVKQVVNGEKVFDRDAIAKEAQDKHSVDKKVDEFKERYQIAIENLKKNVER